MMNFWYDQNATIISLQNYQAVDLVFDFILTNVTEMATDFEIKRLVIGLATLTLSPNSVNLDQNLQNRFPDFMKALVYLCQKSIAIRDKE